MSCVIQLCRDGRQIALHAVEIGGFRRVHLGIIVEKALRYLHPKNGYIPSQMGGLCRSAGPRRPITRTPTGRWARTFYRTSDGRVSAGHWTAFVEHLGLVDSESDLELYQDVHQITMNWIREGDEEALKLALSYVCRRHNVTTT